VFGGGGGGVGVGGSWGGGGGGGGGGWLVRLLELGERELSKEVPRDSSENNALTEKGGLELCIGANRIKKRGGPLICVRNLREGHKMFG